MKWVARSNPKTKWNCPELDAINQEMKDDTSEEGQDLTLILAIAPVQFLAELDRNYTVWRGYLAWMYDDQGILDRITKFEDGRYEFDDNLIETRLKQAAVRWLDHNLASVLEAQKAMQELMDNLWHAKQKIYLEIAPKRKEFSAKASARLVRSVICFTLRVLEARSESIERKVKKTIQGNL